MKEIKVLGTGCTKCKQLYNMLLKEIDEQKIEAYVKKDEDITSILSYNISSTPAIVIDDEVVFSGGLPSEKQIREILLKSFNQ